jgi:hypothetical protein
MTAQLIILNDHRPIKINVNPMKASSDIAIALTIISLTAWFMGLKILFNTID